MSLVAYGLASSDRAIGGGEGGSGVTTGTAMGDVVVGGVVGAVLSSGGAGVHPARTPATTTQIAIFADKPMTPRFAKVANRPYSAFRPPHRAD